MGRRVALAGFLELALVSFALLTRASALAGRPGGVDAAAVWGVSLASGAFSALHELVGPAIGGTRSWEVDPGSLLAACVRLTAPLVAALLWDLSDASTDDLRPVAHAGSLAPARAGR